MPKFELSTLQSYDDESLIAEIRRAIAALPDGAVTTAEFNKVARVHFSTLVRRFGGWRESLEQAGLGHRYGGPPISKKMRKQHARRLTDEELLSELRTAAAHAGSKSLTTAEFDEHSRRISSSAASDGNSQ